MKYFLPVLVLFISCSGAGSSETGSLSLLMFPLNEEWEFLSVEKKDRIIMQLKRTEENKFTYRIELLRDYYGLPLDYGQVTLQQSGNDSTFNFQGGNDECIISLKMYQSTENGGGRRLIIERTCADSTKNIKASDFPPLWRRGEAHQKSGRGG